MVTSSSNSSPSSSSAKQKYQLHQFTDSDDLLFSIGKYIRANEKGLKLGEATLYLNPSCLEYLNLYFRGKRVSFKVNKNELLDLQFIVTLIRNLKLESNLPEVLEKWKELDLTLFESIKVLEINYIKPALITNLMSISQFLTKISIHQSLYSLDELIVVEDETKLKQYNEVRKLNFGQTDPLEIQYKRFQELYIRNGIWSKLAVLDCSFNYIPKIDSSMYSLIAIEKLNLEGNLITKVENLHECLSLRMLNLSSNRISSLENIHEILGFVTHLNLRNNILTRVDGLCRLFGMEYLDISRNQFREIDEVTRLKSLPQLQCLNIEGNPLCEYKNYRGFILTSFFEDDMSLLEIKEFYLDGTSISQNDIEFIRKNSGTKHQSLRDMSLTPKKKSNKIKPMKEDESPPALFIAPNAKITRPEPSSSTTSSNLSSSVPKGAFQRTVDLETSTTEPDSPYYDDTNVKVEDKFEEENKLRKKINDLRNEGGNAWLRILNEMESEPDINVLKNDHDSSHINKNNHSNDLVVTREVEPIKKPKPERKIIKKVRKVRPRSEIISNTTVLSTSPKASTPLNSNPSSASPSSVSVTSSPTTSVSSSTSLIEQIETPSQTSAPSIITTKADLSKTFNENIKEEPVFQSPKVTSPKIRPKSEYISKGDLQLLKDSISTASLKPKLSTSPSREHKPEKVINKLVDNPDSKLLCEPFFVVKFGSNQEILLEIKSDIISETSPTTGSSIRTHLLNTMVFVKKYSRPPMELIEITYGKDFKDGIPTDFFKDVYIMEDAQAADLLSTILRPLLKEYTMSCMDCSERYTCREEYEFTQCVKCHSKYLFFVPSPKITHVPPPMPTEAIVYTPLSTTPVNNGSIQALLSSSLPSDSSLLANRITDATDDDFNNRMFTDQNLQLHFRLNLFSGGSQETYVYLMQSNFITYNTQEDERSLFLLLSSKKLYLLKREKKITGPDQGFSKIGAYAFKDIRKISIGLLYQFFRIELEDVCYVFLKRAHDPTHKFLDLLFDCAKKEGANLEPYFRITDTMFNIGLVTATKNDFQLYIMLHQKVSSSKTSPRSLIITNDKILLCIENYIQWPLLNKNIKTTSPQFSLVKSFKITDISSLQHNISKPTELTIKFEVEGEGDQQWSVVTSHSVECKKMMSTLSRLWKQKFHLDLSVTN